MLVGDYDVPLHPDGKASIYIDYTVDGDCLARVFIEQRGYAYKGELWEAQQGNSNDIGFPVYL